MHAVLKAVTTVYGQTETSTPNKYKMCAGSALWGYACILVGIVEKKLFRF